MNFINTQIFVCLLLTILVGCSNEPTPISPPQKPVEIQRINCDISGAHRANRIVFDADTCSNSHFTAILEGNLSLGLDTLRLRIYSPKNELLKDELLNVPADLCSISFCENDYVVVGFACGGPCYSSLFIFTDERKIQQFAFAQKVANNPNLVAHIEHEVFEKLYISNLENREEMAIDISDNVWMANNGQMDTIYLSGTDLNLQYITKTNPKRRRRVSIEKIL